MLSEISQSQKNAKNVYDSTYMRCPVVKFIQTESRMGVTRGWGSYCFMGTEFSFCKMKRVMEMDGENGCTTI